MADKIQIRAGNKSGMPTLTDRELAYVRDENALYIGTPSGNKDLNGELKQAVIELQETVGTHGNTITQHGNTIAQQGNAIKANADAIAAYEARIAALEARVAALESGTEEQT